MLGDEKADRIRNLVNRISRKRVFQLPDLNKPVVVQAHASELGFGALLLQEWDQPVALASPTITEAKRNSFVTVKESLAIAFALKKIVMFLDGARFTIQTVYQALYWLQSLANLAGGLTRWALTLQRYDYPIEYEKGATNTIADALSRAPLSTATQMESEETMMIGSHARPFGIFGEPAGPGCGTAQ